MVVAHLVEFETLTFLNPWLGGGGFEDFWGKCPALKHGEGESILTSHLFQMG